MADKKEDKKKGDKKEGGDKKGGDKKGGDKKEGDKKPKEDKKKGDGDKGKKDDKPKGDGEKAKKGGDDKPKDKAADKPKAEKAADKPAEKPKEAPAAAAAAAPAEAEADVKAGDAGASTDEKAAAPAAEPLDPQTALKAVLRTSLFHDGLARGLHESVKALDRREAHLCVLSSGCNEPAYVKLITALCSEHSIPLIKVEDGKVLGEWVGLCKFNSEGKPVKVVGCSCAVIRSWGEETEARQFILDHIKQQS
jgi:small subunit ribosomal protein S12e